ncbi:MAG: EAL domain-containing protein [Gallionella sp.]
MRIATRLKLVTTATIAALTIIAPYLLWAYLEFTHANKNYQLADEIKANFFERTSYRDQYFLYRENRVRLQWDKNKEQYDQLYRQAKSQFHDETELQTLERLNIYIQETATIFHRIVNNTEVLKSSTHNKQVYEELDTRLFSQLLLKAAAVRNAATTLKDYEAERARQTYEHIAMLGILLALTLSISLILIAGHLGKLIRVRLLVLHDGAKNVTNGDLNFRIKDQGDDEFSELAQSLNLMTEHLQNFTNQLESDINERKIFEKILLRESEKNLALLHNASDGIHILDANGNIVEASDSFCAMLGYTRDEVIGMNVSQWDTGFPDPSSLGAKIRQQLENPVRAQFETRHRRKDGTIFDVEVSGFTLALDGKPVIFSSSRDISERKANDAKLKESLSLLTATLESTNDAMLVVDLSNTWVLHNQKFLDLWGIPNDIVASGDDTTALSTVLSQLEDAEAFINKVQELYAHCEESSFDSIRFKNGRIVERYSIPHRVDGAVVGRVWSFRDVTERQLAEESLKRSDALFRSMAETLPVAIYVSAGLDQVCEYVNPTFVKLFGYTREEVQTVAEWWPLAYPDVVYREQLAEEWQNKVKLAIETQSKIEPMETVVTCKDGSRKNIYWGFITLGEKNFAFGFDLTARKQAEQQLRIAATAFDAQEGMTVTDENGNILRVNQAFTRITGYSSDEVIGKNPRILKSGRQSVDFYINMWQRIASHGSWEGEIWNRRKNGEIYPEYMTITAVKNASGTVANYVATFNDITLSKASAVEIENLAFFDPLTKLPNRRLLLDRLSKALATCKRSGNSGALLFLDLDHFKNLNDTLGHNFGDLLLQQVAERLTSCVREGDTVARLGGDEFVVMLEDLSSKDVEAAAQAGNIASKILAALNQPYHLDKHLYNNSPSIGIALIKNHEQDREDLLKQADIAMYQSKKAGRNTISFFDPEMQQTIDNRVALESDMWAALEQSQFVLFYQIQVDDTGRTLGAEALIRWQHPQRGWILPAEFIPLAEEVGLILPIGSWVLETACKQLQTWQQNTLTRDLKLSINMSAKQFHQAEFVSQVQDAVKRHGVNPEQLKLELTETLMLVDIEDTIAKMIELKDIGIQFSLDDFGTGFSSLQYLKRLPIGQLKIDQSFVRDIMIDSNDRAIVQTIIAMAEKLNLEVIAEGVENEDQRGVLLASGCKRYQGYMFGRPMPIEAFDTVLSAGRGANVAADDSR